MCHTNNTEATGDRGSDNAYDSESDNAKDSEIDSDNAKASDIDSDSDSDSDSDTLVDIFAYKGTIYLAIINA